GLMELVVLTIGYEMNILSPPVFTILVLMTLVTTFMTTPLLFFIKSFYRRRSKLAVRKRWKAEKTFKILLSFGRAGNGQIMLNVAHQMFSKGNRKLDITALHLTTGADVNPLQTDSFETVSFNPILTEAGKLDIPIHTRYEISSNVGEDITNIVNEGRYHFLLVGAGITWSNLPNDIAANQYRESQKRYLKPLSGAESWFFPASLLKDKTKLFIEQSHCPVGVFVNRDFETATRALLILDSGKDLYLLAYARTLLKFTSGSLAIINRSKAGAFEGESNEKAIKLFLEKNRASVLLPEKNISSELLVRYNFMLIGYNTWNDVSEHEKETLQVMPSTLIVSS
ncbi:MAG: cation/H(+) antiporter, partial [Candidatus Symbiothrix sp.]|nr:cation/H(+) antiporter [Candidatus Symbiothrix sp.]